MTEVTNLEALVVIGAVHWVVGVTLGEEQVQIYRDGRNRSVGTWRVRDRGRRRNGSGISIAAQGIPPLVLRQLERELWAVMEQRS
jgi:hypothetical protein